MSDIGTQSAAAAAAPPAGRRGLWIPLVVLLIVAGAGAAWFVLPAREEAEPRIAAPIYFVIDDNLIVNFQGGGRIRYLQVGVQVMTRQPVVVDRLKTHLPVIRNNLIMLFSDASFESLSSRDGKDALRDGALAEVQGILTEHYGDPGVEAVFFTTFVMQ